MKSIGLLLACTLGALLAAGCGHAPIKSGGPPLVASKTCKRNDIASCTITVSVGHAFNGVCEAQVGADERVDVAAGHDDAALFWQLHSDAQTAGYFFVQDSVVFFDWQYDDQWKFHKQDSSQTQLKWTDKNRDRKAYAYAVVVVRKLGDGTYEKCVSPDPWIHNN